MNDPLTSSAVNYFYWSRKVTNDAKINKPTDALQKVIDELTGEYIPVELGDSGIVVTNWQDEITRAAITNHYKFAINGGTDKHNYNYSNSDHIN